MALKILPEQFASDSQRMGRFQREAQVLASLSHANIGHNYGIEDAGATKALVLELIEGPTLADKIALQFLLRNIKITSEGKVKILDFGLYDIAEVMLPISQ